MKNKNTWIVVGVIIAIIIGIALYFVSNILNEKMVEALKDINEVQSSKTEDKDNSYTKSFGSYKVSDGWIESKTHSTKTKFFYVESGKDKDKSPDNISINVGTNKYKEEEHVKFREAIISQLSMQMANKEAVINANGSTTDKGYIVYEFEVKEEDITTIQYYIVGDYKYVLVHETVFNNREKTDKVAKEIVNSFTWK